MFGDIAREGQAGLGDGHVNGEFGIEGRAAVAEIFRRVVDAGGDRGDAEIIGQSCLGFDEVVVQAAGGAGIGIIDKADIPAESGIADVAAQTAIPVDLDGGAVNAAAFIEVDIGSPDAEIEGDRLGEADLVIEPALEGRGVVGLRQTAEQILARQADIGRERARDTHLVLRQGPRKPL